MSINVSHWTELVDRKDDYGYESMPNNPKCTVKSDGCSKNMESHNLCFWHSKRMGNRFPIKCDCGQEFTCVDGDSIGRYLVRNYYKMDFSRTPVMMCGILYCCGSCQNSDSELYACGNMNIGNCCVNYHDQNKIQTLPIKKTEDE